MPRSASLVQSGGWTEFYQPDPSQDPTMTSGRSLSYQRSWNADDIARGDHKSPMGFHYSKSALTPIHGQYIAVSGGRTFNVIEGFLPNGGTQIPLLDTSADFTRCYNDALSKITEKIRGSLDLATSLAESGQTVKMLNLVGRLTDGMADMKRSWKREVLNKLRSFKSRRGAEAALRRWQRGIKSRYPGLYRPVPNRPIPGGIGANVGAVTSALANGWCEYTYGWSPLINDIRNVANNIVGFTRNSLVLKASATRSLEKTSSVTGSYGNWTGPVRLRYQGFVRVQFGVRLWTSFDVDLARWTSLNPLSVAWELMPYSFVYDWVLDIGSYLRNLETSLIYRGLFRDGYVSTLERYDASSTVSNTRKLSGTGNSVTMVSQGALEYCTFSRDLLYTMPTPRFPRVTADLGSSRLLSAAALLRQLIR
jgi:hypothetical protein